MIFDLHIHEATFSDDSSINLIEIIKEAKRKGLNGVCITDHESNGLVDEAKRLSAMMNFPVIVGIEILTTNGDLLAFGVDAYPEEKMSAQELVDWVSERGGACIAAHPYRQNNRGLEDDLFEVKGLVAIEGWNGRTPYHENQQSLESSGFLGMPVTGGSDAHLIHEVGCVATRFDRAIYSEKDLVDALKTGVYEPVVYSQGKYLSVESDQIEITA